MGDDLIERLDLTDWPLLEGAARLRWGVHPIHWPVPPLVWPRWWQRRARRSITDLEAVFGTLTRLSLTRYWQQVHAGQSVYEDAGGYMIRCYRAMAGYPVEEPFTYAAAASALLASGGGNV